MEEKKNAAASAPLGKPGGLYDGVKLTRRGANALALVSLALLTVVFVLVLLFGRSGITVSFDPNGGTDVSPVRAEYGQPLQEPEPPSREGYAFDGWYRDPACSERWEADAPVTDSLTLYAGWEKQ